MTIREQTYKILDRVKSGVLTEEQGICELTGLGLHPGQAGELVYEIMGGQDVIEVGSQAEIDEMTDE